MHRKHPQTALTIDSYFANDSGKSDPRLPSGGITQNGYGRDLSHCDVKEFGNVKTVYVK